MPNCEICFFLLDYRTVNKMCFGLQLLMWEKKKKLKMSTTNDNQLRIKEILMDIFQYFLNQVSVLPVKISSRLINIENICYLQSSVVQVSTKVLFKYLLKNYL